MPFTLPAALLEIATTPESSNYSRLRSSYMKVGAPRLILQPRSAAQASEAIVFASKCRREEALPFSVRSGGHGISGQSTNEGGIILDLSKLREIALHEDRSVTLGAGAVWAEVARALAPRGQVLTSGNFGGSGVGGLISAGGVGYMLRAHGLTIDHLLSAKVLLPNGEILHSDTKENSDLFWSLKGGAGQTGVALSYTLRPQDLPEALVIQQQTLQEVRFLPDYVAAWGDFMRSAPREFTSFLTLQSQSGLTYVSAVNLWAGSEAEEAMPTLKAFGALAPLIDHNAEITPYPHAVLGGRHPNTGQQTIKMRNSIVDRADKRLGQAMVQVLLHQDAALLELRSMGGALREGESSAFAHRTQEALVALWSYPAESAQINAMWEPVSQLQSGIYSLYTSDTSSESAAWAWPNEIGKRLKTLAETYDPEGLFTDGLSLRRQF